MQYFSLNFQHKTNCMFTVRMLKTHSTRFFTWRAFKRNEIFVWEKKAQQHLKEKWAKFSQKLMTSFNNQHVVVRIYPDPEQTFTSRVFHDKYLTFIIILSTSLCWLWKFVRIFTFRSWMEAKWKRSQRYLYISWMFMFTLFPRLLTYHCYIVGK